MSGAYVPVLGLAGVVITALAGYWAASRRLSGRVGTSEASSLWEESASIRQDYRDQINADRERIAALEQRVANAEQANNALARENLELLRKVAVLERERDELRERLDAVESENAALRRTIQRMTAQ